MPTEDLLRDFGPWMRQVAGEISRSRYIQALYVLDQAEDALQSKATDSWLRTTCLATRALIHQEAGDLAAASRAYEDAQALIPSPSDYMVNQLGLARLFRDSENPARAIDALETGLSVADQSIPTALSLLVMYAGLSLSAGSNMPLRWSSLYLKACSRLGIAPREFNPEEPHSFTVAVAETPLGPV
jgi:tetratricopeptide (TPR) repeat protein